MAAAKAGVQVGDIVLAFDGKKVESSKRPADAGGRQGAGQGQADAVAQGRRKTRTWCWASWPAANVPPTKTPDTSRAKMSFDKIGLAVSELSREQRADARPEQRLLVEKPAAWLPRPG